MEEKKFIFTDGQVNNLLVFLDRVNYQGFKEIQAVQEIIGVLKNPISEQVEKEHV